MLDSWLVWQDNSHDRYTNMAIDEVLLNSINQINKVVFRLYSWEKDTLSIGYMQSMSTLGLDKSSFVRRLTGGGVVEHTKKSLTYSVIFPKSHFVYNQLEREKTYEWVHNLLINFLKDYENSHLSLSQSIIHGYVDKRTMECFQNTTRYDLVIGGKKIAGSAQRRTKYALLHQGVIDISHLSLDYTSLYKKLSKFIQEKYSGELCQWDLEKSFPFKLALTELLNDKYKSDTWNLLR